MTAWILAGSGAFLGAAGALYGLWMRERGKALTATMATAATLYQDALKDADHWRRACDEVQAALSGTQDSLYEALRNLPDFRGMLEPQFRQLSAWRVRTVPENVSPDPTNHVGGAG